MTKAFISAIMLMCFLDPARAEMLVNVKDFGAQANGIADDTRAIQKAINSADPKILTTVYFPAGTYRIGSYTITENYLTNYSLKMHSNIHFRGDKNKSVLRLANNIFSGQDLNANAHIFSGAHVANIIFSNLIIDLNGANNLVPANVIKNHAAIFLSRGNNIRMEKVTIKNAAGRTMINIMNEGKGLVIKDCKFLNGGYYVGSANRINRNQMDFSFIYSEWDDTHISNSTIKQGNIEIALAFYTGGIELHGNNSTITNSSIIGCYPAVYISSTSYPMNDIRISNNKMLNCIEGISFWIDHPIENVLIQDNIITLTQHRKEPTTISCGIKIPNGNSKEYNRSLANGAAVTNLTISRNSICAPAQKNLSAGLLLHSVIKSTISNNRISGMNYTGIGLLGSKWGIDSLIIKGNNFYDFNQNNNASVVAGYVLISDTYSPMKVNPKGLQRIIFENNKFTRRSTTGHKQPAKGVFRGAFIAVPEKMQTQIKFKNNQFSDAAENIDRISTDQKP